MAGESSCSSSRRRRTEVEGDPNTKACWCGLPAKIFVSHTSLNPERKFLRCPRNYKSLANCGFFEWVFEESKVMAIEKVQGEIERVDREKLILENKLECLELAKKSEELLDLYEEVACLKAEFEGASLALKKKERSLKSL